MKAHIIIVTLLVLLTSCSMTDDPGQQMQDCVDHGEKPLYDENIDTGEITFYGCEL